MAKLFISMCGEGRGHAARVSALVEHVRHRHELTLFAPGAAYQLLAPLGKRYGIEVQEIPGITNRYTADHRFNLFATGLALNEYVKSMPRLIGHLEARLRTEKPDLVLTDFEPALPRAAERCGVPYVSIDHQHVLVVNDLSSLPPMLQWHAFCMGLVIRRFYTQQCAAVVSSFYQPPLKPQYQDTIQVGVLLRPAVREARRETGEHVVAYFRRFASERVLDALRELGVPVHAYGLERRGHWGNIEFRPVDGDAFVEDLASCRALIATAGNQLVGEALYLGKPVCAMPEPRNFEQAINAHFLKESGGGDSIDLERCEAEDLLGFLKRADEGEFREGCRQEDGAIRTLQVVDKVLKEGADFRKGRGGLEAA